MSSLCIDCSKINKLRVSWLYSYILLPGGNLWSILLDYKVELYFRIFDPEIRKQTVIIFASRPKFFKWDSIWITLCPHVLLSVSHDKSTNRLKHTIIAGLHLPPLLRKICTIVAFQILILPKKHCVHEIFTLPNRAHCAFQFRPTLLSNVWNLKQFSTKTIIILVINFGLESAIFNLVLGQFIWAEVILDTPEILFN